MKVMIMTKKKIMMKMMIMVNNHTIFLELQIFKYLYLDDEDETDIGMLDMDNDPGSSSGCTAVVTLLRDKQLFVANAGDSRCVVCRGGRAIEMSIGQYLYDFIFD